MNQGFKQRAFQRGVLTHHKERKSAKTVLSLFQNLPSNDSMIGNAFLPSNLFSNDEANPRPVKTNWSDPPEELLCLIGLVLMVDNSVLASDGVTYERASINNWFQKNMARIKVAQENLNVNLHSECDQRVIENEI